MSAFMTTYQIIKALDELPFGLNDNEVRAIRSVRNQDEYDQESISVIRRIWNDVNERGIPQWVERVERARDVLYGVEDKERTIPERVTELEGRVDRIRWHRRLG